MEETKCFNYDEQENGDSAIDIIEASSIRETYISLIIRSVDTKIKNALGKGLLSFSFSVDYDLLDHNTCGLAERIKMSNQSNISDIQINYVNPSQLLVYIRISPNITVSKMLDTIGKTIDNDHNVSLYPVKIFMLIDGEIEEYDVSKCFLYTDVLGNKALGISNSDTVVDYLKNSNSVEDLISL